ncbi:MAG: hypothetical protein FE834_03900 [Gammaproteobacteria bacterium]|nr:hypothetical protein [Gammaproteobacteria bacterium]
MKFYITISLLSISILLSGCSSTVYKDLQEAVIKKENILDTKNYEYFHCDVPFIDTFWRFNLDVVNQEKRGIHPFNRPVATRTDHFGDFLEFYEADIDISKEWYSARYLDMTFFLSRTGEKSYRKGTDLFLDMGVCKNYIKGEDLSTLFENNNL